MHRNTYLDAPRLLDSTLALGNAPGIRFAGQITGTEGYLEAVGTGLLCALNTASELSGLPPFLLPRTSALGALVSYATDLETQKYQPMHVNWGIVPPLESRVRNKRDRYAAYAARALADVRASLQTHPLFSNNQPLRTRTQFDIGGTDA
jgi:methylenetetrahydrofolate--tRNA-(uracil-5-)-methyltransferase